MYDLINAKIGLGGLISIGVYEVRCIHFYFGCSAYIRCLLLCSFCPTSPCSSCVGTWLLIKFAVQKKKKDKVDWGFLKQTLIMFGFALVIIKLLIIIYSLSSISISLLCNGEKTESFTPTHGLRQGDTLSHISLFFVWKDWVKWFMRRFDMEDDYLCKFLQMVL